MSFGYAVIGQRVPHTVTASAPSYVSIKATYSLDGSASYPSNGWQWDRSDNGGSSWYLWESAQNSSFIAYAGNYYVDWRLSASRIADAAKDTGYAQTHVCVETSGCDLALSTAVAASLIQPTDDSMVEHYGSGAWLVGDRGMGQEVIQLYSLTGAHRDTLTQKPNFLGSDIRGAQAAGGSGISSRVLYERTSSAPGWAVYKLTLPRGWNTLRAGVALDPDLGARAGDDQLQVDSTGLVIVKDETAVVAYLLRHAGKQIRPVIRQFSNGAPGRQDPASDVSAAAELLSTHDAVTGHPDDVRFLLAFPSVEFAAGSRGFELITLSGKTEQEVRALIGKLPRYVPDTDVPEEADAAASGVASSGYAMRLLPPAEHPSARPLPISASVMANDAQSTSAPAAVRELVRKHGITSVGITVPEQQNAITVRIFAPNGRLVRTLVQEVMQPGNYRLDWDKRNDAGAEVSAGVYVVVMEAGGQRFTRRFVVVR
ncbi:MAG: FlgD immunoglobulin-like domain containing protein [Gemmatimonadota bacterium]